MNLTISEPDLLEEDEDCEECLTNCDREKGEKCFCECHWSKKDWEESCASLMYDMAQEK